MILVPVKEMSTAKQRLAAVLTQEQRTALARAMLKDLWAELADVTSPSARATGNTTVVLDNAALPRTSLDIDRPADLAQLLSFPMHTRTQKLLCEWKLPERWRGKASA